MACDYSLQVTPPSRDFAQSRHPALHHPRRMRMQNRQPLGGIRRNWPEQLLRRLFALLPPLAARPHSPASPPKPFSRLLHHSDRFVHRRARRHAIQKPQLINAHAQSNRHRQIEAVRSASSVYFSSKKSSCRRQRNTPSTISVASAASSGFTCCGPSSACSKSLAYAPSDSTRRRISYAIFLARR